MQHREHTNSKELRTWHRRVELWPGSKYTVTRAERTAIRDSAHEHVQAVREAEQALRKLPLTQGLRLGRLADPMLSPQMYERTEAAMRHIHTCHDLTHIDRSERGAWGYRVSPLTLKGCCEVRLLWNRQSITPTRIPPHAAGTLLVALAADVAGRAVHRQHGGCLRRDDWRHHVRDASTRATPSGVGMLLGVLRAPDRHGRGGEILAEADAELGANSVVSGPVVRVQNPPSVGRVRQRTWAELGLRTAWSAGRSSVLKSAQCRFESDWGHEECPGQRCWESLRRLGMPFHGRRHPWRVPPISTTGSGPFGTLYPEGPSINDADDRGGRLPRAVDDPREYRRSSARLLITSTVLSVERSSHTTKRTEISAGRIHIGFVAPCLQSELVFEGSGSSRI